MYDVILQSVQNQSNIAMPFSTPRLRKVNVGGGVELNPDGLLTEMFEDGEPNYDYRVQMLHRFLASEMRLGCECKTNTHTCHHTTSESGCCNTNTCVFGCNIQTQEYVQQLSRSSRICVPSFYNFSRDVHHVESMCIGKHQQSKDLTKVYAQLIPERRYSMWHTYFKSVHVFFLNNIV